MLDMESIELEYDKDAETVGVRNITTQSSIIIFRNVKMEPIQSAGVYRVDLEDGKYASLKFKKSNSICRFSMNRGKYMQNVELRYDINTCEFIVDEIHFVFGRFSLGWYRGKELILMEFDCILHKIKTYDTIPPIAGFDIAESDGTIKLDVDYHNAARQSVTSYYTFSNYGVMHDTNIKLVGVADSMPDDDWLMV